MARLMLRVYGLVFAVAGLLFVFAEPIVLALLEPFGPLPAGGPSLWLGLTGSLMAVISWLAFRLALDPENGAAWGALWLSKAMSSGLFLAFWARTGNAAFAASACVDGAILAHLAALRVALERRSCGLAPRLARRKPFYETWFARVADAQAQRALWVRFTLLEGGDFAEAACWAIFFDGKSGRVVPRRWTGAATVNEAGWVFRMGDDGLTPRFMRGAGAGASFDLKWRAGPCPPASLVPAWLRSIGLTDSGYDSLAPAARFDGQASLDGETWRFADAEGCVGHVWGRRYADGWWWAHGAFRSGETVFEILSGPGPAFRRATAALLWRAGELMVSNGPVALMRNRSQRRADEWTFRARFGGTVATGACTPGPIAELEYRCPEGRRVICRNSKLSTMRLRLAQGGRAEELTSDSAAVEFAEARP